MDKYYYFRKLMDLINDEYEVIDADMNNYAGDIEITGIGEGGTKITIKVTLEEGEKNGN